jgi:tetratricopeptide (TPR) repeat protein
MYLCRGKAYMSLKKFAEAMADFETAQKVNPISSKIMDEISFNRGKLYAMQNDNKRAVAEFGKAVSYNKYSAKSYYNRALIYVKQKMNNQACDDLYQAGAIYAANKQKKEAADCLNLIRQTNNKSELIAKLASAIEQVK